MERTEIPNVVIAAVSEALSSYYYSHTKLNTLFMESGAPGEPPEGNCVTKCHRWLTRCNQDPNVDPLEVLGNVLQPFMDTDFSNERGGSEQWAKEQKRIRTALAQKGLAYQTNGRVLKHGAIPTRTLADILRARDLSAVGCEFERALTHVESDPPAAVTAACAVLEALFKTYIGDKGLTMPEKQTIKDLWRPVRDDLGLDPASLADDDQKRILSGLASVVDGVGSLRTHAGSAHGRSPNDRPLAPREARLAVHASHTLAVYVLETWC